MNQVLWHLFSFLLVLTFGLTLFRKVVPRDYQKHGKLSPFVTFLELLLFFSHGWLLYSFEINTWPAVFVHPIQYGIGFLFVFTGLSILFYGMFHQLGIWRSMGRGEKKLQQEGLYSLSRNPQSLSYGVCAIGFAIVWPSWYAAVWVLLYGVLIHLMVLAEEEHLLRTHGQEYEEYCIRTPRYFRKVVNHTG